MTFYAFRLLSPAGQLYWVLQRGTFLAGRAGSPAGVTLYHVEDEGRGFFSSAYCCT